MGIGVIRTLLAASVVLGHSSFIAGYNVANPVVAVESFYIISGFYMALILNEKYVGPKSNWFFFSNRFLKLYPIYWLVLLLSVAVSLTSAAFYGADRSYCLRAWFEHGASLAIPQKVYLVGTNLLIFGQDATLFLKLNASTGFFSPTANFSATNPMVWTFLVVPQSWTLALELLFYCLAPLIVRQNVRVIAAVTALSLALRVVLVRWGYSEDPWNYRFFPLELAFFCAGAIAYANYRALKTVKTPPWLPPVVTAGLLFFLLAFNYLPVEYNVRKWCFYAALVIALPFVFQYSKAKRADRFLGELSYPIYIVHILICAAVRTFYGGGPALGFLSLTASILAAIMLYAGFQKPIESYRQRRLARSIQRGAEVKKGVEVLR
jgi:peptidoglycan/LPS O-acetylase OafA/YrhL